MHKHKAKTKVERPFTGGVSMKQDRRAHGGVCVRETCACGATRDVNRNGGYVERGEWSGENDR